MIRNSCRRVFEVIVLAVLTSAGRASAQQGLLAAGVGSAGNWETEVELANPFDQPMTVLLSEFPANDFNTGCDFGCAIDAVELPAHGSKRLKVENGVVNPENDPNIAAFASGHLFTLFLARLVTYPEPNARPQDLPIAHVHAVNRISGAQTEIPVVSLASIMNRKDPGTLVFPGVVRSDAAHCNLILSSIDAELIAPTEDANVNTPGFTANLKLFDEGGALLASRDVSAAECRGPGSGCANAFILDVAQFLGVASLPTGSLQVSQATGGRMLWGEMPCVSGDGAVVVYSGSHP